MGSRDLSRYGDALFRFLPRPDSQSVRQLRQQSDMLELVEPGALARAHVLADSPNPKDSPILFRGQAETPGDVVPRRFLEVLSGSNRPRFRNGSGRLELANAIASKTNPLTARVMVNRVWQHHFGEGFVSTPDDLGNQSSPPTHPELLDWLATRFMADDWSVKKLHKVILLSATWQQSSRNNPQFAEKDPFNRFALARKHSPARIRALARFHSQHWRRSGPDTGRSSRGSLRRARALRRAGARRR